MKDQRGSGTRPGCSFHCHFTSLFTQVVYNEVKMAKKNAWWGNPAITSMGSSHNISYFMLEKTDKALDLLI